MSRKQKQYFIIVDTETTINDTVADFGAVVVDSKGTIVDQFSCMVRGQFDTVSLFYDKKAQGLWAQASVSRRTQQYYDMLDSGARILAAVPAINQWLESVSKKYAPILTAYNLAFDTTKCANTGINLELFPQQFCLWAAAVGNICNTKPYKNFVLMNHLFNAPTAKGNMTFRTDAESVSGFLSDKMIAEPHTALEDAVYFELPILLHIIAKRDWSQKIKAYNWADFQVRDHFRVK